MCVLMTICHVHLWQSWSSTRWYSSVQLGKEQSGTDELQNCSNLHNSGSPRVCSAYRTACTLTMNCRSAAAFISARTHASSAHWTACTLMDELETSSSLHIGWDPFVVSNGTACRAATEKKRKDYALQRQCNGLPKLLGQHAYG